MPIFIVVLSLSLLCYFFLDLLKKPIFVDHTPHLREGVYKNKDFLGDLPPLPKMHLSQIILYIQILMPNPIFKFYFLTLLFFSSLEYQFDYIIYISHLGLDGIPRSLSIQAVSTFLAEILCTRGLYFSKEYWLGLYM